MGVFWKQNWQRHAWLSKQKKQKTKKKKKEKKKNPPSISHRAQAYPSVSVSPRATKRQGFEERHLAKDLPIY